MMMVLRGQRSRFGSSTPLGVRLGVVLSMVGLYGWTFSHVHQVVGAPAFLIGHVVCLLSALLLGLRGAALAIVATVWLDRNAALTIGGEGMGFAPGIIAALSKLVVAGGAGVMVDVRRRLRAARTELLREIDARERTEASLVDSETMSRALVRSLGEGVGLFDTDDRCVFFNDALARALHTSADELRDRPFGELLTNATRSNLAPANGPDSGARCYEIVPRASEASLLLVTETELAQTGKDALRLRVVRDLSERVEHERRERELERELQRGQALQGLAVLAGGVAHDFNNLLNGVVGNVELAQRRVPAGATELIQYLDEIKAFAAEAAHLSRQMLAYAGRRSLAIGRLDVNAEIADALRLLHATVESKARLRLDFGGALQDVAADRFQLRQVLTNLVLNALEAMSDGRGTLTLSTCMVDVASTTDYPGLTPGEYVKVSVSDSGPGIPEELRERIFEPFYSTKSGGRGMGLAAAAGILRTHKGWLGVEEQGGRGATISMLLPLASPSTPVQTPALASVTSAPLPSTVLLVDDEPAVRLVTTRLLVELGQQVLTAESGSGALKLFRENRTRIDLVVLDLTMPDRSGAEVLVDLRSMSPDVRVVITSGFHRADASELMALPNVVGFLEKPHTLANLEALLNVAQKRARPPEALARSRSVAAPRLN